MRHQVAGKKLNRSKGARIALRRNLINQLFTHERIQTTEAKASAMGVQPEACAPIKVGSRFMNP